MTPYQQWSLANEGKHTDREVQFDSMEEYERWRSERFG